MPQMVIFFDKAYRVDVKLSTKQATYLVELQKWVPADMCKPIPIIKVNRKQLVLQ